MTISRDQLLNEKPLVVAGPCAIESRKQIFEIVEKIHKMGVTTFRCQLFKPRTDKDSFQGVGKIGLMWLKEIKEKFKIRIVTEVLVPEHIELTKGIVDILWVGSRNMQNYELLKELAKDDRPIILKRGFISTVDEWMASAKYIGLERVIMCERGIRTGADSMRFTLDINSALVLKHDHHMPVIVDPSHSAGRADMVEPLILAAIAAGVNGIVVEVHNNPEKALSDKDQQITPEVFSEILEKIKKIYLSIS